MVTREPSGIDRCHRIGLIAIGVNGSQGTRPNLTVGAHVNQKLNNTGLVLGAIVGCDEPTTIAIPKTVGKSRHRSCQRSTIKNRIGQRDCTRVKRGNTQQALTTNHGVDGTGGKVLTPERKLFTNAQVMLSGVNVYCNRIYWIRALKGQSVGEIAETIIVQTTRIATRRQAQIGGCHRACRVDRYPSDC